MLIREALDRWYLALESEGRRPDTLESYRWHWSYVLKWLEARGLTDLDNLNPPNIRQFIVYYEKDHAPATVRTVFISIRAFVNWAKNEDLIRGQPLKNIKQPKADLVVKTALTPGEVTTLLAALNRDQLATGKRNLALITLMLDTGARASEVCALEVDDLQGDSLILRRTKNGKPRPAFLGKKSSLAMHRYLVQARPQLMPKCKSLFVADSGQAMTRNSIHCILNRLSKRLGFHVNAHQLRHTWATNMARAGLDANTLMALAGWSVPEMAQRYIHLASGDLRESHHKAAPLDSIV